MATEKTLIAMSGGVDSSVAAWLALQQGHACIGGNMRLFEHAPDAPSDAAAVAERLGIPFYVLDLSADFRRMVVDNFVSAYEQGLTPNPCICCNRHLKFALLPDAAASLGCRNIVTGHYARVRAEGGRYLLYKAADPAKDQSYFLYAISQERLARVRFPLGELTKQQVRQIAQEQGFLNAHKRDSQDICFIPDGDYAAFLRRYTGKVYPHGDFLDIHGNKVGTHSGSVDYTLGQRKGLGLAMGEPVYVCAKDMAKNTVTVGPNEALFHRQLIANDWFFFPFSTLHAPLRVMAKARSRMTEQPATVYPEADGSCRVVFDAPQRALTPGQAVVLYEGDLVIGGGTVAEVTD